MKKLLSRASSSLKDSSSSSSPSPFFPPSSPSPFPAHNRPSALSPPSPQDVLRYRAHHGTNLGSVFVLERWLTPSMFPGPAGEGDDDGGAVADSELAAVAASLRACGRARTQARWARHWAAAVSEADFQWLVATAKCTSVRVPVGYWTLGEGFCGGTPFAGGEGEGEGEAACAVYAGAWAAVKDLVRRARAWGVGVLVDFHALPGGANADAHSGSGSGEAELWRSAGHKELALRGIKFMVTELREMEGVIGLQVVNEAAWGAPGLYEWYEEVLRVVGEIDDSMPLYFSDVWDLERALTWSTGRRGLKNPVVVDTHKYYTFSDRDRSQTPAEIINRIPNELSELNGKEGSIFDRGEAQVIIGEYSCVLDGQTWARIRPEEKEDYVTQFGRTQSKRWQEKAGGAYFWTFKMDWMDGGEWGFVEQVKKANILPPLSLQLSKQEVQQRAARAQQQRDELAKEARASHDAYWHRTCPGQRFEHERYSKGWQVGFSDALSFFVMRADEGLGERAGDGGDRIGCTEIWTKKRLLESGQGGAFVWEWEQGFRAGVKAFDKIVGI